MTIARFAQDRFEYQDLVTLRFLLVDVDRPNLEVRPEPDEGEDTEVLSIIGGERIAFDIQAKDENGAIDIARIAYHLAHPSPHKTDETLLDRLIAAPPRTAVFVTSARLSDDAVAFAADATWAGETRPSSSPKQTDASDFLKAFAAVDLGVNGYEIARKAHRVALAASLKARAVQAVLRRVLVLERTTPAGLYQACVHDIACYIRAPEAAAQELIDTLLRIVRSAKASGQDVVPEVRLLLNRHRRRAFGSADYEPRGHEDAWAKRLERDGVLLLGGPPRCGKTETAEHLANRFLDKGFEVLRADDLADAPRYLHDNSPSPRVVLVDDPLGDGWSAVDVPGAYDALRRLIPRVSPSRLLLVAQNQTPLLNAANVASLEGVSMYGRTWVDLSGIDPDLAERVWRLHAEAASVPATAIERLARALAKGAASLDPGTLQHLAFSGRIAIDTTVADMLAIADEDAASFGQRIANDDPVMVKVLAAFGMATDPATGLDPMTLAFIIDGPVGASPGQMRNFIRITGRSNSSATTAGPQYRDSPVLTDKAAACVETLENRRILATDVDGRLQLSHGFYRAAALGLLRRPAAATADRHLGILRRALFCLNPRVSRAAARNLARVHAALPEAGRDKLITLAAAGLTAVFPGTRDLCWRFLIGQFDELSKSVRGDLPQWLANAYATSLDDIVWRDGEAWIATEEMEFSDWRMFRQVRKKSIEADLKGLEGAADYAITPERANLALGYYKDKPRRLNATAAMRLLSIDEAALRGEAARIWLGTQRGADAEVLDRIFEERHPRIALDVLRGIARGWGKLTVKRQAELTRRFKLFVASPTVALPLLGTLVLFNRVEHFPDPPWTLFAELLPLTLDQLTDAATGEEPRLFVAVQDAIPHLPASMVVEVCRAWIAWLARTKDQLRGDHAWGVIPILIEATRHHPALRAGVIEPLFSHLEQSGAASMLVHELEREWDDLTDGEQGALHLLLTRKRKDGLWLKAIVLTSPQPPEDLQRLILGELLTASAFEIEAQLCPELLKACLEVHLGIEPFGFLGLSDWDREPWCAIVDSLAARPDHALARMCLTSIVQIEATDRVMAALPAWADHLDDVFELLLRHYAGRAGGPDLKPAWEWIFVHSTPEQRDAWDGRIADVVVGLVDDVFDFHRDFGIEVEDLPRTAKALENDVNAMVLTHRLAEAEERLPGTVEKALPVVLVMLTKAAPVLFGTFDYVTRRLKTKALKDDPHWDQIWAERKKAFAPYSAIKDELRLRSWAVDRKAWSGPM